MSESDSERQLPIPIRSVDLKEQRSCFTAHIDRTAAKVLDDREYDRKPDLYELGVRVWLVQMCRAHRAIASADVTGLEDASKEVLGVPIHPYFGALTQRRIVSAMPAIAA